MTQKKKKTAEEKVRLAAEERKDTMTDESLGKLEALQIGGGDIGREKSCKGVI